VNEFTNYIAQLYFIIENWKLIKLYEKILFVVDFAIGVCNALEFVGSKNDSERKTRFNCYLDR